MRCNPCDGPFCAAGHKSGGVHVCGVSVRMCINSISMLPQNKDYQPQHDSISCEHYSTNVLTTACKDSMAALV